MVSGFQRDEAWATQGLSKWIADPVAPGQLRAEYDPSRSALTPLGGPAKSGAPVATKAAPVFSETDTLTFLDSAGTVFTFSLPLTDAGNDAITYSLSGPDTAAFTIDATTGEITFDPDAFAALTPGTAFDVDAVMRAFEITVSADDGTARASQTVSVVYLKDSDGDGVADIDDNATFVANPDQSDSNADGQGDVLAPDINGDGLVNALDFSVLASSFNSGEGDAGFDPRADLNDDGVVSATDFSALAANFNTALPQGSAPTDISFAGEFTAKVIDLEQGFIANAARVLPLGDSITQGFGIPGAFRLPLYDSIVDELGLFIDFVGPEGSGSAPDLRDRQHQGVSSIQTNEVLDIADTIAELNPYDVALVLLGTNDVLEQNEPTATTTGELGDLLRALNADRPGELILVGKLPEIDPNGVFGADQGTVDRRDALNDALPGLIDALKAEGLNVELVDTDAVTTADLFDSVHPTEAGHAKLADAWLDGLLAHAGISGGTFNGRELPLGAAIVSVTGSNVNDRITGDGRDNVLDGGPGNDVLDGGRGFDTLIGGSGDDTFVLRAAGGGAGTETTIADFESGDVVQLVGFGFAGLAAAEAAFSQSGTEVLFSAGGLSAVFENASLSAVRDAIRLTETGALPVASAASPSRAEDEGPIATLETSEHSFDFSGLARAPTDWLPMGGPVDATEHAVARPEAWSLPLPNDATDGASYGMDVAPWLDAQTGWDALA